MGRQLYYDRSIIRIHRTLGEHQSIQYRAWNPSTDGYPYQGATAGQFARDRYNHNLAEHMDGWREFVEAHYYYSKRRDTPFWRAVTDEVEYKMEGAHRVMLEAMVTGQEIEHGQDPIVYILAGSGYTNVNSRLDDYFGNPPAVDEFDAQDMYLKYQKVKELASSMPSMASYLQETVWS